MAKSIPAILTRRRCAHRLIAQIHHLQLRWQGWQDARQAVKAKKQHGR